jgi:hypothetical protein
MGAPAAGCLTTMKPFNWKHVLFASAVWIVAIAAPAMAQAPATARQFFPFVIPWDDNTSSVTDMSWMNASPAGADGYIVAKNGHFYAANTGKRIRFLGTSFTFDNDFPSHADAEKVAAHLAKLGINIVRIHHHDADYGQLWDKKYPDHQHIDPSARDRLDYLIYQLKMHGIYVDLNLHVSRQFTAADGFPASVDQIELGYDKRVDYFDPRMIELQKSFAADYLTHVNPYTSRSYANDPCVAMIEINNENTLVQNAGSEGAAGLADLPEPFHGELTALWNRWLKNKYSDDRHLKAAWTAGIGPLGDSQITSDSEWFLEHQSTTEAQQVADDNGITSDATAPPAHFHIYTTDGTDWHVQTHINGLDLTEGKTYTVTFRAKADADRAMNVNAGLDEADWHNLGLNQTANLTTDWQSFTFTFDAVDTVPNHGRIDFVFGNQTGDVWISDLQLRAGAPVSAMIGDASLAYNTIPMPTAASKAERLDWVAFLADTERQYAATMRGYLKHELGVHANIVCTQISYGNAEGLYREQYMEIADNHNYWQHPGFPGKPWDPQNWLIQNSPMTASLASGGGGTLRSLAEYRVDGKPYTISEYNEPAPSDYRCEAVPELAAYAAEQDWDGIFFFDWGNYGASAANSQIQGFFATGSDPARAAFLPAAAAIFRGCQVPKSPRAAVLTVPLADSLTSRPMEAFWNQAGLDRDAYLTTRLSVRLAPTGGALSVSYAQVAPTKPQSDKPPVVIEQHGSDPASAYFTAGGRAAFGYLGGRSFDLGENRVTVDPFGNNFCAVAITPIKTNTLVTIVGQVENRNMVWNADRTSVSDRWGSPPSQAEYIPATISVPAGQQSVVYALNGSGGYIAAIPSTYANGKRTFHTDPTAHTVWYAVLGK